jgi:hypothetical protein
MNPVDWLKTLYGWIGADHPRLSLFGAILLGAFLGGMIWKFAAHVYAKDQTVSGPPSTTVNTTNGPQSPIIPNNNGNVTITNDQPATSQHPAKDGSK